MDRSHCGCGEGEPAPPAARLTLVGLKMEITSLSWDVGLMLPPPSVRVMLRVAPLAGEASARSRSMGVDAISDGGRRVAGRFCGWRGGLAELRCRLGGRQDELGLVRVLHGPGRAAVRCSDSIGLRERARNHRHWTGRRSSQGRARESFGDASGAAKLDGGAILDIDCGG